MPAQYSNDPLDTLQHIVKNGRWVDGCYVWQKSRNWDGYGSVQYLGKRQTVSRVFWILVFGDIPDGLFVLHTCDNPPCFAAGHLYLGSHKENTRDKVMRERMPRGESHKMTPLTEEQVNLIHQLRSKTTAKVLAGLYGVDRTTIQNIWSGKTWKHIKR